MWKCSTKPYSKKYWHWCYASEHLNLWNKQVQYFSPRLVLQGENTLTWYDTSSVATTGTFQYGSQEEDFEACFSNAIRRISITQPSTAKAAIVDNTRKFLPITYAVRGKIDLQSCVSICLYGWESIMHLDRQEGSSPCSSERREPRSSGSKARWERGACHSCPLIVLVALYILWNKVVHHIVLKKTYFGCHTLRVGFFAVP